MNISEMIFLISVLGFFGLTLFKLYNVLHVGKYCEFQTSIITLVGALLAWGVGLVTMLHNVTQEIYVTVFLFCSLLLLPLLILFMIEVFFLITAQATAPAQPYIPEK